MTNVEKGADSRVGASPGEPPELGGKLVIKKEVVIRIAAMAAREVGGFTLTSGGLKELIPGRGGADDLSRGINADVREQEASFYLSIAVDYGRHIPSLVAEVRKRIRDKVKDTCDIETSEVNVEVVDVRLPGVDGASSEAFVA
jgi:uncharacterized alkaline shock family protein YloU